MYDVPAFRLVDSAIVDGAKWYTISCKRDVSDWIRSNNTESYYAHPDPAYAKVYSNTFNICETLYIMMILKWS